MTVQSLKYTVTMDANLAREVGVPAAMLYNLLVWTSQSDLAKDYDSDGWFYFTAKSFTEKTTFSVNTYTVAIKKLAENGLIEYKTMYKKHSHISANHFRILPTNCESPITANVNGIHSKCESYIYKENSMNKQGFTKSESLNFSDSSFGASQATPAQPSSPTENSPFGEGITVKSVRPGEAKAEAEKDRRRVYAVANSVRNRLGLNGKITPVYKNLIKNWLDAGFTEDDIVDANRLMQGAEDGFHEKLSPTGRLSADSMDWYQEKSKRNSYLVTPEDVNSDYEGPNYVIDDDGFLLPTV